MTITTVASKTHLLLRDRGARHLGWDAFFFSPEKKLFCRFLANFFLFSDFHFSTRLEAGDWRPHSKNCTYQPPPHPIPEARGEKKGRASGTDALTLAKRTWGGRSRMCQKESFHIIHPWGTVRSAGTHGIANGDYPVLRNCRPLTGFKCTVGDIKGAL